MSSRDAFRQLIATPDLPSLGPRRRSGAKDAAELSRVLDSFFTREQISSHLQPFLRSAALLWHDCLDASHTISQGIETRNGSWLHGIMHRREPDYGNAKYWFRRVGQHDAFPELAQRVALLLHNDSSGLTERLIENGEWRPFAFIDECERAEQGRASIQAEALPRIQAVEFDVLVEHIFAQSS